MILTSRALFLFFASGISIYFVSQKVPAYIAFLIFNGLWCAIVLCDYLLTPGRQAFDMRRLVPPRLSNGVRNRIEITVDNRSSNRIVLLLGDDTPWQFERDAGELIMRLEPQARGQAAYHVVPRRRGTFDFGYLWMRVPGVLGLVVKQFRIDAKQSAKVYPDSAQIATYELFASRSRLAEVGLRPRASLGQGMDFDALREYHRDDEYRRINWKATARRQKIIVEHYEDEKSQDLIIVLDTGRLMAMETGGMTRLDHAINASVLIAYAAMRKDDRVGLLAFSRKAGAYLPPSKGKRQFNALYEKLQSLEASKEEPDFGELIGALGARNRKRSLIIIFTELSDVALSESSVQSLRSLYPHHLPLCVLIGDPAIKGQAAAEPMDLRMLYRKAGAVDFLVQRELSIAALRRAGVTVLEAAPEHLSSALLNKYLEIKLHGRL
jgi:uncharacterized protein (DUF58 family)